MTSQSAMRVKHCFKHHLSSFPGTSHPVRPSQRWIYPSLSNDCLDLQFTTLCKPEARKPGLLTPPAAPPAAAPPQGGPDGAPSDCTV